MTEHSLPILGPLAWIDFVVLGWLVLCGEDAGWCEVSFA
jgi:hypothetical protein